MTQKELSNIRVFIEQKSILLMKSEGRTFVKSGFDISHYSEIEYAGRKFVIISTNVFYQILNGVLIEACEKYPENFGKDDVNKVLQALYQIENVGTMNQFSDFLKTEQFAWILEVVNEKVRSHVLRVELFRQTDKLKNDESRMNLLVEFFIHLNTLHIKEFPFQRKRKIKKLIIPNQ